jgi:hypothetical protein
MTPRCGGNGGGPVDFITIISSIFTVLGVFMLIAGGRQWLQTRTFVRNSLTAKGTVVSFTETRDRDEISYFPKVKFTLPSGAEQTFLSKMGRSPNPRKVGDIVTVRYRPDQSYVAEIDEVMAVWGMTMLYATLGLVFLVIGLGILLGVLRV